MRANELRIGNYVLECGIDYNHGHKYRDKEGDKIVKIASIQSDNTIRIIEDNKERGCYKLNDNFEPIPLTEEWLLNFGAMGAIVSDEYLQIDTDAIYILFKIETKEVGFYADGNFMCIKNLKYVHELQNLYFALTKTELQWQNLEN